MSSVCQQHPDAEARYRCEGCGRLLCDDCVDVLRRLAVCRPCGDLARPLESSGGAPVAPGASAFAGRTAAAPGVADVLRFPLRGRLGKVLAAFTLLLAAPVAVEILVPPTSCLLFVVRLLLALLLPGLLADVTRASAEGLPDLPEWPRYPGGRSGELVRFVAVGLLALLPAAFLLGSTGCAETAALEGRMPAACHLLVLAGLWVGAVLWLPLHGVSILRASLAAVFDLPAHARVLRRHAPELATAGSLCVAPLVLAVAARSLSPVPVLAAVLEVPLVLYGAVLGAHLAGRFLLEHREELETLDSG